MVNRRSGKAATDFEVKTNIFTNTVELITTLGALFPRGGPVPDPVHISQRLVNRRSGKAATDFEVKTNIFMENGQPRVYLLQVLSCYLAVSCPPPGLKLFLSSSLLLSSLELSDTKVYEP